MKNWIDIPIITISLILTGVLCYLMGRYQDALIKRIRMLEESTPYEPEPVITMGEYDTPPTLTTTDSPVGIAETKTPQLVEYETEQETERLGRGL